VPPKSRRCSCPPTDYLAVTCGDVMDKALIDGLEQAQATFQEEPRRGAMLALACTKDFLERMGVQQHLTAPILSLMIALNDLDHGSANPIVKPSKVGGKGPISAASKSARAHAAAAMELLIRSGVDRNTAAATVARRIKNWKWGQVGRTTRKQVEDWRDAAKTTERHVAQEATTYWAILEWVEQSGLSPAAAAEHLFSHQPAFVSQEHDSK